MAWTCINCEASNDYHASTCEVCGMERYFSISEVNDLLKMQELDPSELKKIQTNFKRASTENKNLRQKNKELAQHIHDLEQFKEKHNPKIQQLEKQIKHLHQWNVRWKTAIALSGIAILFFVLAKITITIQF
jgi:DNA repair exonuclease SbcCD ATPase subunit